MNQHKKTSTSKKSLFNYKKNQIWAENLQIIMQIGLTMAGSIAFGLFAGIYLDKWLGTKGIFTIMLMIYGIAGGFYVVYRQIQEIMADNNNNDNTENGSN